MIEHKINCNPREILQESSISVEIFDSKIPFFVISSFFINIFCQRFGVIFQLIHLKLLKSILNFFSSFMELSLRPTNVCGVIKAHQV